MNFWVLTLLLGVLGSATWILSIPSTHKSSLETTSSNPLQTLKRELASVPPSGKTEETPTLAESFSKVIELQEHKNLVEQLQKIDQESEKNPELLKIKTLFGSEESEKMAYRLIYLNTLKKNPSLGDLSFSKKIFDELQKNPTTSANKMENILDQLSQQIDNQNQNTIEADQLIHVFLRLDYYTQTIENSLKTENTNRHSRLTRLAGQEGLSPEQSMRIYAYLVSTTGDSKSILESTIYLVKKNPHLKASLEKQLQLLSPYLEHDFQLEVQRLGL